MTRTAEQLASIALFADALPVAIWVGTAPKGDCVYVNREFERVLGITPPPEAQRGNYVGPYSVHLPTGEPYPERQMPFEQVMRARAPVVVDDIVIHRHDGEKTYLRVFASPLFDEKGEVAYVVEGFTDITREVESERQRRESERQVHLALRLESVGSLAGGIAHDFNNLLSIVKLVAANLRQGEKRPERLELITHLDEVSDSAAQLTRALLGFAHRGRSVQTAVNLNEVVRSVTVLARRTFERRLTVTAELGATPGVVLGDAAQLDQILMNLIFNARDAIPGSGRILVRTSDVTLSPGQDPHLGPGRYVALEVEDSGTGIDPAVQDRIFEPYFTTKTAGPVKGTGLGLATVYGLTHAHGGWVRVARSGPRGTTMQVLLPAASRDAQAAQEPRLAEPTRGTGTVLVVDDEALVLKTATLALRELGYRVLTAAKGPDALRELKGSGTEIAAVVLNLSMPEMSGLETYGAMRAARMNLPVIFTTGGGVSDEVRRLVDEGKASLLQKPYTLAELSGVLARVLQPRSAST